MPFRSLRTFLIIALVVCLSVFSLLTTPSSVPHAEAMSHSKPQGHSFKPAGYGTTTAHKVSTFTVPQIHTKLTRQPDAFSHKGASVNIATSIQYPALQNVVRVPLPNSTNSSATKGIQDQNQSTADTSGAGGTVNYLETANVSLAIFGLNGTEEYTTTLQQWFGIKVPYNDPFVNWDSTGNRFIFSVNVGYELLLSVAQQSSAQGKYCTYAFPTPGNYGSDFEKLGVNAAGVYLGANLVNPNSGNLVSNEMFLANRTAMEKCVQNVNYVTWTGLTNPDNTIAEAITPANEVSNSSGIEFLVNSIQFGGCSLTFWMLNPASQQMTNTSIPTQCYSPPPTAEQKGSKLQLGTGQDNSLTQASYFNGQVIVSLPGSYTWGQGQSSVSIIQWFIINAGNASLVKQGAFGRPGYWFFFPAAVITSTEHLLFVFNVSGPTIYPSLWYVNQTFNNTTILAEGNGSYQYGKGAPWGYYSSAWLDTSKNSNSVWITGEFALAKNIWGSEFALVKP